MASSEISVQEAKELLEAPEPPVLVDCREPTEYAVCHLENAELIPFPVFISQGPARLPDKSRTILIYCHHGVRSAYAADYLSDLGYEDVRSMRGGIEAWAEEIDPSVAKY
jgi:rhodanese-related sulfurtransferase